MYVVFHIISFYKRGFPLILVMTTGSCEGVFRWLNKNNKWQWLSGSGRVILKNNRPDFVITTNKPLS